MGEFYRHLFNSFTKGKKISRNYSKYTVNFTEKCFARVLAALPTQSLKADFSANVSIVVHSHRYNNSSLLELSMSSNDSRDQSFSEMDFSLVRDVMYKYSKKAQEKFFQVPELCFLYAWFANNPKAMALTKLRLEGKDSLSEYKERIIKEI